MKKENHQISKDIVIDDVRIRVTLRRKFIKEGNSVFHKHNKGYKSVRATAKILKGVKSN